MWSALTSLLPGSHGSEARRGGTSSPIPPLSAPTSSTPQHDNPDRRQTRSKKREMPIPLKPPRREYLGTSVQNLHHERPENPEEISDDDIDEDIPHDAPLEPETPAPKIKLGRKDRPRRTDGKVRLLGALKPANDTVVCIPDPQKEHDEKMRKQRFVQSGPYRPMNTLDSKPASTSSTRSTFNALHTTRSIFTKQRQVPLSDPDVRDNDFAMPNKKRKTGASPRDGNRDSPINVDDSQDFDGFDEDDVMQDRIPQQDQPEPIKPGTFEAVEAPARWPTREHPRRPRPVDAQSNGIIEKREGLPKHGGHGCDMSRMSSNDSLQLVPDGYVDPEDDDVRITGTAVTTPEVVQWSSRQASPQKKTTNYRYSDHNLLPEERRPPPEDVDSPDPLHGPDPKAATQRGIKETPSRRLSGQQLADLIVGNKSSTRLSRRSAHSSTARKTTMATGSSSSDEHGTTTCYEIKDIAGHFVPRLQDQYRFCIGLDDNTFWVNQRDSILEDGSFDVGGVTTPRKVGNIRSVHHGETSCNLLIQLRRSESMVSSDFVIELESNKRVWDLITIIQSINQKVGVGDRSDDWMERAFLKKVEEAEEMAAKQDGQYRRYQRTTELVDSTSPLTSRQNGPPKTSRRKATDNLNAPAESRTIRTVISGRDREGARQVLGELPISSKPIELEDRDTATSPYFEAPNAQSRGLRSRKVAEKPRYRSPTPKIKFSKTGGLGLEWTRKLEYPKDGKKREVVEWVDLERLDDDEFLNDNLVAFFARYVQHQLEKKEPALLKRMHFFSTYFFETLTRDSKSRKEINHAAVSRWTRSVDIFSRDFVIVPVNDNLHWFVCVICNLPKFTKKKHDEEVEGDDSGVEALEVEDGKQTPAEPVEAEAGDNDRTKRTQESLKELSIEDKMPLDTATKPEQAGSSQIVTESPHPKKRGIKKKIIRRQRYDPDDPIIITLDSLNQPRGNIVSALKDYIVLEAKDKKGLNIERAEIQGMTAKGIPLQNNYSDCGLYMCMYLEQFANDPKGFVRKILQREEAELRWPKGIKSEDLRSRLRSLILELHRKQEDEALIHPIPEFGRIMVNMRESSPEIIETTPPPLPPRSRSDSSDANRKPRRTSRDYQQANNQLDLLNAQAVGQRLNPEDRHLTAENSRPSSSGSQNVSSGEIVAMIDKDQNDTMDHPIVIPEESPEKRPKQAKAMKKDPNPPYKPPSRKKVSSVEPGTKGVAYEKDYEIASIEHSDPQELANNMAIARNVIECQDRKSRTRSPKKQQERSQSRESVSTEFLAGDKSYGRDEVIPTPAEVPGSPRRQTPRHTRFRDDSDAEHVHEVDESQLSSQVPETQQQEDPIFGMIDDMIDEEPEELDLKGHAKREGSKEMLMR